MTFDWRADLEGRLAAAPVRDARDGGPLDPPAGDPDHEAPARAQAERLADLVADEPDPVGVVDDRAGIAAAALRERGRAVVVGTTARGDLAEVGTLVVPAALTVVPAPDAWLRDVAGALEGRALAVALPTLAGVPRTATHAPGAAWLVGALGARGRLERLTWYEGAWLAVARLGGDDGAAGAARTLDADALGALDAALGIAGARLARAEAALDQERHDHAETRATCDALAAEAARLGDDLADLRGKHDRLKAGHAELEERRLALRDAAREARADAKAARKAQQRAEKAQAGAERAQQRAEENAAALRARLEAIESHPAYRAYRAVRRRGRR